MACDWEFFDPAGPLHLKSIDWENQHHKRSVIASLIEAVSVLEGDRQEKREGSRALASPWWEYFQFRLLHKLVDNVDSSIFGAVFEYNAPSSPGGYPANVPHYIIAFRGTLSRLGSVSQDLKVNLHFICHCLDRTSRFDVAMKTVCSMVAAAGKSRVWLAGHSLGAAIAMLVGKTMARAGMLLESFLFNPPYLSFPIERLISNKNLKHWLRFATSLFTAGLSIATKGPELSNLCDDGFVALSAWVPYLFVNPADHLSCEFISYFEHRKEMEEIGAGAIEKLSTQHSIGALFMSAIGVKAEPVHLIPSAVLIVNLTPSPDFRSAHTSTQWWNPKINSNLQCNLYRYS